MLRNYKKKYSFIERPYMSSIYAVYVARMRFIYYIVDQHPHGSTKDYHASFLYVQSGWGRGKRERERGIAILSTRHFSIILLYYPASPSHSFCLSFAALSLHLHIVNCKILLQILCAYCPCMASSANIVVLLYFPGYCPVSFNFYSHFFPLIWCKSCTAPIAVVNGKGCVKNLEGWSDIYTLAYIWVLWVYDRMHIPLTCSHPHPAYAIRDHVNVLHYRSMSIYVMNVNIFALIFKRNHIIWLASPLSLRWVSALFLSLALSSLCQSNVYYMHLVHPNGTPFSVCLSFPFQTS